MQCPDCGGPAYDNRAVNRQRIQRGENPRPDYACKDKNGCGWKQWPPKGDDYTGAPRGGGRPQQRQSAPQAYNDYPPEPAMEPVRIADQPMLTWRALFETYKKCAAIAVQVFPIAEHGSEAVVAATASVFKHAIENGLIETGKPAARPAPPPPPPPPVEPLDPLDDDLPF